MIAQTSTELKELVDQLSDSDPVTRQRARTQLVAIGSQDVTRALLVELNDPRQRIRWESAKALDAIADPISAAGLVLHLDDPDDDVRWLAAEALAKLGESGLLATLTGAIRMSRSTHFCHAAHHAFKEFHKQHVHADVLQPVIKACDGLDPTVHLPLESYRALCIIRTGTASTES
ncbi:MAG: HEAT repeat domain-containing protein [Planctomycetales bacterium]|nr:HEAT repeat domain-containing protein [Planctomycetales bacterium]